MEREGVDATAVSRRVAAVVRADFSRIARHGGQVTIRDVDLESGTLRLELAGACTDCCLTESTARELEARVREAAPEIDRVAVDLETRSAARSNRGRSSGEPLQTRAVRWFVVASAASLVGWQLAALVGAPARTQLVLGLYGFVLTMVMGQAYWLLPSFFGRELAFPPAPAVQFPITIVGVAGLALAPIPAVPDGVAAAGAAAWTVGVGLFLVAVGRTVAGALRNGSLGPAGSGLERLATAVMPLALAYLAAGSYETLATSSGLPSLVGGEPAAASHLLAAGTATLLLLAIGFRLLPRFLGAPTPAWLLAVVLSAGAVAPALLAAGFGSGTAFRLGAAGQAIAVIGFALAVGAILRRSDSREAGAVGVGVGATAGVAGVLLGVWFAVSSAPDPALLEVHRRANLLGFLGLSIVGVAYQFYPPSAGRFRGAGDRTGIASIALLGGGLALEAVGLVGASGSATAIGRAFSTVGAALFCSLVVGLFRQRSRERRAGVRRAR